MNFMSDLQTSLLDLLFEIKGTEIKLIIGGGYGIFLKVNHVQRTAKRTLFHQWPEPRATNDLDLFLRPEFLIEPEKLKPMAKALNHLGYEVVRGAEKYQFAKPGPRGVGSIKIDILTGPKEAFSQTKAKADQRRVRPKPSIGLHAHPVDEAITLEQGLVPVSVEGRLDSGENWAAEVFLPHPYTFLMMKLFAFRDRLDDGNKEFGRYHALDLYAIAATTTEDEWRYALELKEQCRGLSYVAEAAGLIGRYFSAIDQLGIIRLKESPYYRSDFQLEDFMAALQELFPLQK